MLQMIISSYIIMASVIFMQMNHPLAMGLMLLIQTLLVSLAAGIISKTFWFSYILFLVFLGGMLVLFIYVSSLASNEMFSLSMKIVIISLGFMMGMMSILLFMDLNLITTISENIEMTQMNSTDNYIQENSSILNKMYNYPTNLLTLMLINYLLVTLVAIVKITNVFYGPLRSMN